MKNAGQAQGVETKKVVVIASLYAVTILIMALGVVFGVASFVNDISFQVMSMSVHGAVFGLVIAFLGLRYFMSVTKLKAEVYKKTSSFSWSNFKRVKKLNK